MCSALYIFRFFEHQSFSIESVKLNFHMCEVFFKEVYLRINGRSNVKIQARFFSYFPLSRENQPTVKSANFAWSIQSFEHVTANLFFVYHTQKIEKTKNRQILHEFSKRRRFWKFYEVYND